MRPGRIRIKTGGNSERGDGETVVKDPSDENVWNLRTGNIDRRTIFVSANSVENELGDLDKVVRFA